MWYQNSDNFWSLCTFNVTNLVLIVRQVGKYKHSVTKIHSGGAKCKLWTIPVLTKRNTLETISKRYTAKTITQNSLYYHIHWERYLAITMLTTIK
jgi:hypothetical protein